MSLRVVALCGECREVCAHAPYKPGEQHTKGLAADIALRRRMSAARHTRQGTVASHVCRPAGGAQLVAVCVDCGHFAGQVPYQEGSGASQRDLMEQVAARHGYVGRETVCASCVAVRRQKPERAGVR